MEIVRDHNVTNLRRANANEDCNYWKCMLNKYGMLDSNDNLNVDNYFSHLDRWLSLNPDFNPALLNARTYCRDLKRYYFPLTPCEFYEFHLCIRGHVNVHCPVFIQSKECMEWKEFYNDCKEYYI
ncbi:hypothetical protein KGM_202590 [Danaus plexippus plexippus]|uniref:Uncharacterized protein n=1 Tax=Danaus plexippus plexippus TaxID=278856 RepID=A0A212ET30_DANPL|nr:hypothetical protein KGM_202590 [Danaus plexippus plexippus]